jgi:CRISPR/Cas system CMR subunit Cmr6 (Cas7 group RAMP superfamily)
MAILLMKMHKYEEALRYYFLDIDLNRYLTQLLDQQEKNPKNKEIYEKYEIKEKIELWEKALKKEAEKKDEIKETMADVKAAPLLMHSHDNDHSR